MVGQEGIELPLGHSQRLIEHRIESRRKDFITTDHRDQVADVMLYVPTVDISVVLVVIVACTQATVVAVIHRFDELAVFILRMEEAGVGVEQVAVVVRLTQVMFGFVFLTQFGCDL